jgi:hypothetical protein
VVNSLGWQITCALGLNWCFEKVGDVCTTSRLSSEMMEEQASESSTDRLMIFTSNLLHISLLVKDLPSADSRTRL